jgi:hypothetical protein
MHVRLAVRLDPSDAAARERLNQAESGPGDDGE